MSNHNRLVEQRGVGYVSFLAAKYGCLFRGVIVHDKGVDADIELTRSLGNFSPIIGVQVKSRSKFKPTAENKISITVTEQNLRYWKSYGHPVILMAYCEADEKVYWTRVDNASSRTIQISLSQKFDDSAVSQFSQIISQYYTSIARNLTTKDVSEILSELGNTVEEILNPVEQKLNAANALMSARKCREAAQIYESLALIYEDAHSLTYNLGVCLLESGEYDKAIDVVNAVLKKSPDALNYWMLLSCCLELSGRDEEAESALLHTIKRKTTSFEAWNNLGLFHWRQGRNEEAYEDLRIASAYAPNNDCVYFNLALCSIALKKYKQAIDYYDKCLKINPNHYDAFNARGLLLETLLRIWDALDSYESAIKIDSKKPYALYNCAHLLKDFGYNERAIQRYHMALEEPLNELNIHLNLGCLYCREDNWSTATYHFEKSYKYRRRDLPSEKIEGKMRLIDIGYEVFYLIDLEITKFSVKILSVESVPRLAGFNISGVRERLKQAHLINEPFSPEDVRLSKVFAPNELSKKTPLARLSAEHLLQPGTHKA
ncbi:MAG: tetratricopeptide repeat protein [Coleofasciculaceae cyanobacterium]